MSTGPGNQPPGQGSSRERSLPPIREVLGAELSNVHSHSAEYHYHGHGDLREVQQHYSHHIPGNTTMFERTHPHGSMQDRASGFPTQASSSSDPFPRNTSASLPASASNSGGHSYGVLRTSGPSGTLTDAIPPSAHPQGIVRQTSYPQVFDQDDANKRFMCEYCGKRFAMPSHLQIHLRTHTADKPFHCPFCNKAFTVKSNLTRHLKAHEK